MIIFANTKNALHDQQIDSSYTFGSFARSGMARLDRSDVAHSFCAAVVDQFVLRIFASRMVGDVRLGDTDVRALERNDCVVDMVRHSRRSDRRDSCLYNVESASLHAVSQRVEACPKGVGLYDVGRGMDCH